MPHRGDGPIPTRIMLVGEAWGEREDDEGRPFVGASGAELNRMLGEAGILRTECFVTNVVNHRPPENRIGAWIALKKKDITGRHIQLRDKWVLPILREGYEQLRTEIDACQPNVIVAFGNTSLWALTGQWGIIKWRGSLLRATSEVMLKPGIAPPKVIPTYHPAAILREWSWRAIAINDLKRARDHLTSREYNPPEWKFIVRPSFAQVHQILTDLIWKVGNSILEWIDFDTETRAGHIACAGISWSRTEALCIPFMCLESREGYWNVEEECQIVHLLSRLLTHPKVKVRWQNGLYDAQYTYRHWHFIPRGGQDTMISQHSAFCALPKSLAFISSMQSPHYIYWKDEGKTWDHSTGEDQLWNYNCVDCVRTRESGEGLAATLKSLGLESVDATQQALFWPVLEAMKHGIRVLPDARAKLAMDIQEELSRREAFLFTILGHAINVNSPKQMQTLFYEDLEQRVVFKRQIVDGRTVMRPSCDDEALTKIAAREPLLRPLCNVIADIRTLNKWLKDFVFMPVDSDGRMRCSFNVAGDAKGKSAPYSYRLSSSENAFGSGGNLQTIPSEKSKSVGKAMQRGTMSFDMPNIRSMFGPDPGFTWFDLDLDRADLQVVVWEADDAMLKAALRMGADLHLLNVYSLDNVDPPPLEELVETHPRYPDHRGPRKHKREFAKVFCHATNYGGGAKTVAAHTGRSVHEVDQAQRRWFGAHPGIAKWHERTLEQVRRHHFVENRFGYRWYIFDRLDAILPEALAWVPQSTVGIVINKIWINLYTNVKEVQVLLQVHDSLAGQFPTHRAELCKQMIAEQSRIVIPYDEPLVIPAGISTSVVSWGDC